MHVCPDFYCGAQGHDPDRLNHVPGCPVALGEEPRRDFVPFKAIYWQGDIDRCSLPRGWYVEGPDGFTSRRLFTRIGARMLARKLNRYTANGWLAS